MGRTRFCSSIFIHAIVCLPFLLSSTYAAGAHNETDRLSLLEFKAKITSDPSGVMSSWNETVHFCQWHGVTCGLRHQRVTVLNLRSLKLAGSLSPHIGNLSFLRRLWLQNNSFHDQIPPQLGYLRRLQSLRLNNNSFEGEIPANLSACSNLTDILLNRNMLVGKIPSEFGSIPGLQYLYVASNSLTGFIPPTVGNLSSLIEFWASENSFTGSIPAAIGQLPSLKYLDLSWNNLSGIVSPPLYNISSITQLWLHGNNISGTLPRDLGITLPNMEVFSIGYNRFTGEIPDSISNASSLVALYVAKNELTGKVPDMHKLHRHKILSISNNNLGGDKDDLNFISSLSNASRLQVLAVNSNNFQGSLPPSIANLSTTIEILWLLNNQIYGNIPAGIWNLENLQRLDLSNNKLTGAIPSDMGMLKRLVEFEVQGNAFSHSIPNSLGNLSLLTTLNLGANNLQGHIPSTIGNCQDLLELDLSDNNLSGTIPAEVIGLSSLSIYLDLSMNLLSGSLPKAVGDLRHLRSLNVSHNMLSGEIPGDLGNCISLEFLEMHSNFFSGAIPETFSLLRGIEVLDLSDNNLTGNIPVFLEDFKSLRRLNLSYNHFQGELPIEGIFSDTSAAVVMGNNLLCGGIPAFHLHDCNAKGSHKRISTLVIVIIAMVSGFSGISLVVYCLYIFKAKKQRDASVSDLVGSLQLSYQSLIRATDEFSKENLIGKGGFGSVYRGITGEDQKVIAVKVLNLLNPSASRSFLNECEALRNIRHRNLVRILTVCSGIDYRGNDFKAIVYELMSNGSLEEWLHSSNAQNEAPKALSFLQRLDIVTDVASALEYLHHQCGTPIIHCDLKPSNVLLDDGMTGHVGDFGLSRFLTEVNHTSQTSITGVRGTVGYAAPEYGMGSAVSTQGDVYSYGILLLELFTGKRPVDDMFKDGFNLHEFGKVALSKEGLLRILDPILLQEIIDGELNKENQIEECLITIFEIGVACSLEYPAERMHMKDVTAKLYPIKSKLLETSKDSS